MSGLKLVRHQAEQDANIEARVKKAGDTMTGNLTMSGSAKFVGNLQGNSDTATRLQTARTISINGVAKSFNGTGNISWKLGEIGASPSNHTHNYLPLSGGTISGNILCNANNTLRLGSATARFNTIYSSILDLGNSTGVYSTGNYILALMCGRQQGGEPGEVFLSHNGTTYHFEPKWSGDVALQQSTGLGRSNRKWRDVWSHAGTLQTSDITMKENIKKVVSEDDAAMTREISSEEVSSISSDSILEAVKSIQPITFNYKGSRDIMLVAEGNEQDEYAQVGKQLGISAQELEKIDPTLFEYVGVKTETVNEAGEKVPSYSIKTLAYSNMILVALQEEIKYRNKQIENLEEKIKLLEKKIDALAS